MGSACCMPAACSQGVTWYAHADMKRVDYPQSPHVQPFNNPTLPKNIIKFYNPSQLNYFHLLLNYFFLSPPSLHIFYKILFP